MSDGRRYPVIRDWKTTSESDGKYQLYLASREWAVLKNKVKERSGGTCEHCRHARGTQTHHQTYQRKYRELLEDLLHVCAPCHEFLSDKRKRDPRLDVPVTLLGSHIKTVYLAGKVAKSRWRDQIIGGTDAGANEGSWSGENHGIIREDGAWYIARDIISIPDGRTLNFSGPYWTSLNYWGGHDTIEDAAGYHACGDTLSGHGGFVGTNVDDVYHNILLSICRSDLIFAWLDSLDSFGTIFEIGLAAGSGKTIVVAIPPDFNCRELWVAVRSADLVIRADTPGEAWSNLWNHQNKYCNDLTGCCVEEIPPPIESDPGNEPSDGELLEIELESAEIVHELELFPNDDWAMSYVIPDHTCPVQLTIGSLD